MVALAREPMAVADAWRDEYPIVYQNDSFRSLFAGGGADSPIGMPVLQCFADISEDALGKALRLEQRFSGPVTLALDPKTPAEAALFPLTDTRGRVRYFLATFWVPPADAGRTEDSAAGGAEPEGDRDASTPGSRSLEYFLQTVTRDMAIAHREKRSLALIVFQIDELDQYQDTFGTQAVDACVRMVGGRIFGCLRRAGDLSSQYASDRFVASVLDQDQDTAEAFAKRVAEEVRELGLHSPRTRARYVTVTTAVKARVPENGATPEEWMTELAAELDPTAG